MAVGLALGYRPDGGAEGVVGAMLVVVAFAFGLSWVFTTLGLLLRAPNAVMNAGFTALFPLAFVSNGFVQPSTLPGWLETIVDINPISHVITAARGLMDGDPSGGDIGLVLIEAVVLTANLRPPDGAPLPDQELISRRAHRHRHPPRAGLGRDRARPKAGAGRSSWVTAREAGWIQRHGHGRGGR